MTLPDLRTLASGSLLAAALLGACTVTERTPPAPSEIVSIPPRVAAAPTFTGPVLAQDGSCTGPVPRAPPRSNPESASATSSA